jgi:hypothetical protein
MNTCKILLPSLLMMAVTPLGASQIFKCDGPDGPVYTDRPCEPGAEQVQLTESSGVSGVSDETKAELARKKEERQQKNNLRESGAPVINHYDVVDNSNSGWWTRGRNPLNRPPLNNRPRPPLNDRPPVNRPVTLPSTARKR